MLVLVLVLVLVPGKEKHQSKSASHWGDGAMVAKRSGEGFWWRLVGYR